LNCVVVIEISTQCVGTHPLYFNEHVKLPQSRHIKPDKIFVHHFLTFRRI